MVDYVPIRKIKLVSRRFKNFFYFRERDPEDVPWYRPQDEQLLQLPRPIVLVNGAFDILHTPHMRMIFSAKAKAGEGSVVVALDSDKRIALAKGPERPILSFTERAAALNYMPVNCLVEIDNEVDMLRLIKFLKPDLRVQGADYRYKQSRFKVRKMLVREGKPHSSDIIERILEAYDKQTIKS